eukprot:14832017-Alexandrium_andersonii.AAC.1
MCAESLLTCAKRASLGAAARGLTLQHSPNPTAAGSERRSRSKAAPMEIGITSGMRVATSAS